MSDSESDFEQCCSQASSVPDVLEYESVPQDLEFKFKIFSPQHAEKGLKLSYKLKEGKTLPYLTQIASSKSTGDIVFPYSI